MGNGLTPSSFVVLANSLIIFLMVNLISVFMYDLQIKTLQKRDCIKV